MRIFLDACIWIYLIENKDDFADTARSHFKGLEDSSKLISSELVRFECMVGALKAIGQPYLEDFNAAFSGVDFVDLKRQVFEVAAGIRSKTKTKALDSLHLAAAIVGNCDEFWTNDKHLISELFLED